MSKTSEMSKNNIAKSEKRRPSKASVPSFDNVYTTLSSLSASKRKDVIVRALSCKHGDWLRILSEKDILKLSALVEFKVLPSKTTIFSQGDKSQGQLWVLAHGSVQVENRKPGKAAPTGSSSTTATLFRATTIGTTFGDSCFFSLGYPMPTTLTTISTAALVVLSHEHFSQIYDRIGILDVKTIPISTTAKALACLKGKLFQLLSALELSRISDKALCLWYHPGEYIYHEGDSVENLGLIATQAFMLDSGTVELRTKVLKDRVPESTTTLDTQGILFGDFTALFGGKRIDSALAVSECRVYAFHKESFEELWQQRPDVYKFMLLCAEESNGSVQGEYTNGKNADTNVSINRIDTSTSRNPTSDQKLSNPQVQFVHNIQGRKRFQNIAEVNTFVLQLESLLSQISQTQPFDASTDAAVLVASFDAGITRLSSFAEEFFKNASNAPADYSTLRQCYVRLLSIRTYMQKVIPESPRTREHRKSAETIQERLLDTPVQYRLKRCGSTRQEPDWSSLKDLSDFLDQFQNLFDSAMHNVRKYQETLISQYGATVGQKLYDSLFDWYEQKCEAWASCESLLARQRQLSHEIGRLRNGRSVRDEMFASTINDLVNSFERSVALEKRILNNLATMNRRVIRSCFPTMQSPAETSDSLVMQFTLELQNLVELKEDQTMAKCMTLYHANTAMSHSLSIAKTPSRASSNEGLTGHAGQGMGEIASKSRDIREFMEHLASWLCTADTMRWDKQRAREEAASRVMKH